MKKIFLSVIVAFLLAVPLGASAQITCRMTHIETCRPGNDGAAEISLPSGLESYCTVTWKGPSGTFYGNSISGVKAGAYNVVVIARACNKPIFQDVVLIETEDACRVDASISVSSRSVPCNVQPTATLTASASGGVPPYQFSWRTMRVSGSGVYGVNVTDSLGHVGYARVRVDLKMVPCSQDPNELDGPQGYSDRHFVSSADPMRYVILFENDPDFATAPASRVRISYPIPPQQNIASVRLSDFGFGSHVFTVPSNTTNYTKRLDVSDSLGVWVDVTAGIDVVNNELFWIFQSVDPVTGFEPSNSQLGFLLVNDSLGHGEGYVSFAISPKTNTLVSGDTVSPMATIIFDDNNAISTNAWLNTFDAVPPVSTLVATLSDDDTNQLDIRFSAFDDLSGSGVENVELLVSTNADAYASVGVFTLEDTARYQLQEGNRYRFISRATDHVGNQESLKTVPDTIFNLNTAPYDIMLSNAAFAENDPIGTFIGSLTSFDNDVNQPFVYELVSGTGDDDNALFRIQGGQLVTNANFSCRGIYDYSVRIRTTDITGLSYEKAFEIICVKENNPYSVNFYQGICQGGQYQFGTRTLTTSGIYTDSLQTVRGCDSIVTVHLTVHPSFQMNQNQSICQNQSFTWSGHNLQLDTLAPGSYTYFDSLRSAQGCDSIYTLRLNVHPTYYAEVADTTCSNIYYDWVGHAVPSISRPAGSYTLVDNLHTSYGCDSVYHMALTVRPTSSSTVVDTACDTYLWHDNTYTSSTNTPTYTTTNVFGCDSVVSLNLTVHPSTHLAFGQVVCDSYSWHSISHAESGTYTYNYTNAAGCASTDTLHLTVNYSSAAVDSATACDSYTWHGNTYTESTATPTFIIPNAQGCDSVITLHLTLNQSTHNTQDVAACDSYTWQGSNYVATGVYTYPYTNAAGCSSTDTLYLTVNTSTHNSATIDACDSYTWHGNTYTISGDYAYDYLNASGCSSTDTLHLTVGYHEDTSYHVVACDSYFWNDNQYHTTGVYTYDHSQTGSVCVNVDTLYLTIHNSDTLVETVTACDAYVWHDVAYTNSTSAPTYSTTNAFGCDSIVNLHLTINQSTSGVDNQTACDSYTWHGITYTASTSVPTFTTVNAVGCDSVAMLHLTVNHSTSAVESQVACDSYTWHGDTYTATTSTPTYTTTNAQGCDSVVTLHLTVNYSSTTDVVDTACDSYTWHGTTYTASTGSATYVESNAVGCDSIVTLHLTVNYSSASIDEQTACDSYTWHGALYTESTTEPTYITTNAQGCDSTVTLHLTVNHSSAAVDELTVCDSLVWNGTTYYTSTTEPTYLTTNAQGCDSTVSLHLTVHYSAHQVVIDSAVGSYEWNGNTYTESGEYNFEGVTADGCDSVVTLILTILQPQGIADAVVLENVKVYPNPTTGKLFIGAEGVLKVEIYDYTGRLVATYVGTDQFDISHLPAGTYALRITLPQGNTIRRVIKR